MRACMIPTLAAILCPSGQPATLEYRSDSLLSDMNLVHSTRHEERKPKRSAM